MSKIYDALRRAERDRKKPGKGTSRRPARSRRRKAGRGHVFLRGIDEEFRRSLLTLRNSIDSEMKQKESRVIMFTSAVKGEGKTTIIASLARTLALGESERILLVDCSVLNPELHQLFGMKKERGILDYLAGDISLQDAIHTLDEGVLDLIPLGTIKGEDATQPLFNSERMELFIKEVVGKYHYVLIDSSSILEAPVTPIIASYADGVVMVVNAGKTRREVIKRAILSVEKFDGNFIGTILNKKKYYIPEFIYRRV